MRTNQSDVSAIISHLPAGVNVVPFIEAAGMIIDRELGGTLTPALLTTLEKFLAAHLVCLDRPSCGSDSGTGVSASYHKPPSGDGLDATPHGRMVKMLDPTGKLALAALAGCAVMFDAIGIVDTSTTEEVLS
jgi:hypothetical protein